MAQRKQELLALHCSPSRKEIRLVRNYDKDNNNHDADNNSNDDDNHHYYSND